MKIETKPARDIETKNIHLEPATDERCETACLTGSCREFPSEPVKSHRRIRPMFIIAGAALCMGLASCVVPYDTVGGGSVTVTSYRPGYTVHSLPGGYRREIISGDTYYYHNGHYYRQGSGGYVVVEAPRRSRYYEEYDRHHRGGRGEVITRLPDGYRVVNYRGITYYQTGDRYYRRQGGTYIIVSRPY